MSDSAPHSSNGLFQPPSLSELAGLMPQYEMMDFLAQGGMGAVYLARQISLDRLVAIKVLPPSWGEERGYAQRFQTEARAMAKLRHNHIVGVYDFGITTAGHLYLVMEYVDGQTMHDMIHLKRLTVPMVQGLALQLCEAIEYAHAHGILHRDLKPGNAMVDKHSQVKVMDFGLARRAEAAVEEESFGTPEYAAPEILTEGALIDHRADIYALGIVFQQMLTGKHPERVREPLPDNDLFDPGWQGVLDKATAADPAHRYQSMRELREAVAQVGKPVKAVAQGPRAPIRRGPGPQLDYEPTPRPPSAVPWASTLVTLVLIAVGVVWWLRGRGGDKDGASPPVKVSDAPAVAANPSPGPSPDLGAAGQPPVEGSPVEALPVASAPPATAPPPAPPAPDAPPSPSSRTTPYELADVAAGHVFQFQEGHRDTVNDVLVLPDQYRVATASTDGTVGIWNLHTGKRERTLGPVPGVVLRVAASSDGQHLAATSDAYHAYVWDLKEKAAEPVKSVELKARAAYHIAFSGDNLTIFIGTLEQEQALIAWGWRQDNLEVISGFRGQVIGLTPVPGEERAMLAGSNRRDESNRSTYELWLLDTARRSLEKQLPGPPIAANKIRVAPDGKTALGATGSRYSVWDIPSGTMLASQQGPTTGVYEAEFLDQGRLVVVGGTDRTVRIFEALTGSEVWKGEPRETRCTNSISVSADQKFLVSAGGSNPLGSVEKDGDYALHVWKLPNLGELKSAGAALAVAKRDMTNLQESDAELWKLLEALAKEWDEAVVKVAADSRKQMEDRYLEALRREIPGTSPRDREFFLAEISRVANSQPAPNQAGSDWPASLVRWYGIYLEQVAMLRKSGGERRSTVRASQAKQLDELEQKRVAQNDMPAAERVRLVKSAIASAGGAVVLARLTDALVNSGGGGGSASTVPSAVGGGVQPVLTAPPMRGESRLRRTGRAGQVVLWRRYNVQTTNPGSNWPETQSDITDAVAISGGPNHVLILRADGTVKAMGLKAPSQPARVPDNLDHVVAVAAGARFDFALREDGSVFAWSSTTTHVSNMRPAVAIHAGPSWGYARHADGSLTRVPGNVSLPNNASAEPPTGLGVIADVGIGSSACVALLPDGNLSSWGAGTNGGQMATIPDGKGSEVVSLAVNYSEAAALRRDGELVVWGENPGYASSFAPTRFLGADRVVRGWPSGAFAVHFPGDRWKFAKAANHGMNLAEAESRAAGCFDVAVTAMYCLGIR